MVFFIYKPAALIELLFYFKEELFMDEKTKVIEVVEEVNEEALQELSDGKGDED